MDPHKLECVAHNAIDTLLRTTTLLAREARSEELGKIRAHLGQVIVAVEQLLTSHPPTPEVPLASLVQSSEPEKSSLPGLVEVADGLKVPAMVLPESCHTKEEVLEAIKGPMLCYVPAWGHFAIRMGGMLLHGNVGKILSKDTPRPMGVKECRKKDCIGEMCTYYHDPTKSLRNPEPGICPPASARLYVRNYFADSFVYAPRGSGAPSARYGSRRYGSADTLACDLATLSDKEAARFLDQVAHDLICAAVLMSNRGGRGAPTANHRQ